MARRIGAGETDYTRYDRAIAKKACDWIEAKTGSKSDLPWVLQVGFVAPHFPLIAPQAFFDQYEGVPLPPPRQYAEEDRPRHPVLDVLRTSSNYDEWFDEGAVRIARQAYYGLVSFLDHNIGLILRALERAGLVDDTRILYASDHGDNLGHRGLWGKSVMYDDAVAVPVIMAGPEVPPKLNITTPVSLVDLHPTIMNSACGQSDCHDPDLPGKCLTHWFEAKNCDRAVVSEYHDWSSVTGMFMLRTLQWKIVRYPGYDDQLFDMFADPHERYDLAPDPAFREMRDRMRARLSSMMDVATVNAQAFEDQRTKIAAHGGARAILESEEHGYTPAPATMPQDAMPADGFEP